MDTCEILSHCDHTLLSQTATWEEIRQICEDGIRYGVASVCIPPVFVEKAKNYVGDQLKICTVIGFPNGYSTTAVKCFEAEDAIKNGADEIDTVICLGKVKEKHYEDVLEELKSLRKVCEGKVLKVIIETCLLDEEEKIKLSEIVTLSGADYIKTSTGFSKGGATREDVTLLRKSVGKDIKVKASGGISSLADAEDFLKLGADRLGTSRVVKAVKEKEGRL